MDIGKNGHRRRTKLRQQQTIGKGVVENEIKAGGKSWLYRINREMNASVFKFLPKLPKSLNRIRIPISGWLNLPMADEFSKPPSRHLESNYGKQTGSFPDIETFAQVDFTKIASLLCKNNVLMVSEDPHEKTSRPTNLRLSAGRMMVTGRCRYTAPTSGLSRKHGFFPSLGNHAAQFIEILPDKLKRSRLFEPWYDKMRYRSCGSPATIRRSVRLVFQTQVSQNDTRKQPESNRPDRARAVCVEKPDLGKIGETPVDCLAIRPLHVALRSP